MSIGKEPSAYAVSKASRARVLATAIHAGHDIRDELLPWLYLQEDDRLREEDPYTDRIAARFNSHLLVTRSRFEVDLNRPRPEAVYRTPEQSWGIPVWDPQLPDDLVDRSLAIYDAFYDDLGRHLDGLASDGPFLVLDIHSYNHRRGAERKVAPQIENPDVNIGTGTMPDKWRPLVETLLDSLHDLRIKGRQLDARENVRFEGGHLAQWVHERYPETGCVLALEFKKIFMDEWTGKLDVGCLDALADALEAVVPLLIGPMLTVHT